MSEMLQNLRLQTVELLGGSVPQLIGALAILIVGWIVALILAALVRSMLRRTTIDNRLADWMAGEKGGPVEIERVFGRVVFWIAMIFVLVAFFEALNLTGITQPLNALLSQITEYMPRVLGAAAILLLAWVVAVFMRKAITLALDAADLDRRLGQEAGLEDEQDLPLSKTVAEAVYWTVFLLSIPAVLGVLGIEGLLAPVQGVTNELLAFLPNMVGAGLILAVGWFIARLLQRIVTNLLAAAGIDAFGERMKLTSSLGTRRLSGLVGLIVYVLILIPVLISALQALQLDAITVPASEMLTQVLDVIPMLFAAGLLLTLSYVIGKMVADLVSNLLAGVGFDNVLSTLGVGEPPEEGARMPSGIVGTVVLAGIMLFATIEAANLLGFEALSALLANFIVFAGDVILALVVLGVGLYLARLAADAIRASGTPQSAALATVARVSIVVLAGAMALRQMGLAEDIINIAFGLLLGAVAVAAALAFGLGSREIAARHVDKWAKSISTQLEVEEVEGPLPPSD
jgi:hypothetical protein